MKITIIIIRYHYMYIIIWAIVSDNHYLMWVWLISTIGAVTTVFESGFFIVKQVLSVRLLRVDNHTLPLNTMFRFIVNVYFNTSVIVQKSPSSYRNLIRRNLQSFQLDFVLLYFVIAAIETHAHNVKIFLLYNPIETQLHLLLKYL